MTAAGEISLVEGVHLGRYRIVRHIGSGGMAAVYEAVHDDLGKRVALKMLHPMLASDAEARGRFLREGRAAARIRHPNVVEVFDVGQEGELLYLVMEHLCGEDLGTLLGREGALEVERMIDLLLPVIAAVMTAHEAGVVHRDLKPENIFLARERHGTTVPKVLDFGISKVSGLGAGPRLTGAAAMLGTPVYMSPEQAQAGNVDHRSDQYALGVILYECATGKLPFEAPELYPLLHAIVQGDHPPPRALRPELPPALDAVIERAMHRDPAQRFESLRALGQALLPFASRTGRGLWREVFGAAPTPFGLEVPAAPTPRPDHATLMPRVRQMCVVTSAVVRGPRGPSLVVGGVALILVAVAALLPWGALTRVRAAQGTPRAEGASAPSLSPARDSIPTSPPPARPPPALVAPAVVPVVVPPAEAPPALAAPEVLPEVAAPVAARPPRAAPSHRARALPPRHANASRDAGTFRLCNGVPCP